MKNLSLQIYRFLIPFPVIGRGLFYFGEFRVQQQTENSVDRPNYFSACRFCVKIRSALAGEYRFSITGS